MWWRRALFLLILFVGALIRIYALNSHPSGFHQDEVANAYIGRYILQNGRDPTGAPWPILYFDKLGDYPPVLPMYLSGVGTYLFGFTPLGARFVGALFGILALPLIFLLARQLFKSSAAGLLAMGMLAIVPWHVTFSRMATEGTIALTVWLGALVVLLHFLETQKRRTLFIGMLLFALTYLLYPGYRVTAPLSVLALWVAHLTPRNTQKGLLLVFALLFAGTVLIATTAWGRGRFEQTGIVSHVQNSLAPALLARDTHIKRARIMNNIYLLGGRQLLSNAAEYFSPSFLFAQSGQPPWFQTPMTAPLYVVYGVLIFYGLFVMVDKKILTRPQHVVVFGLLAAANAPAILTVEHTPHLHRALPMIVPLILLAAYGAKQLATHRKWCLVLVVLLLGEVISFGYYYAVQLNKATATARSDANWHLVQYVSQRVRVDRPYVILASGWMPVYYLFATHNTDPQVASQLQANFRLDRVDAVTFVDADCPTREVLGQLMRSPENTQIVLTSSCKNLPAKLLQYDTIHDAAGNAVYKIYRLSHSSASTTNP